MFGSFNYFSYLCSVKLKATEAQVFPKEWPAGRECAQPERKVADSHSRMYDMTSGEKNGRHSSCLKQNT